jgi:RNA polymerase sigma factor (sigma-70 family)
MSNHRLLDPGNDVPGGDHLASAILGPGEVALFENVYAAYAAEARALALAFLGDRELAEDAVHGAYLEILRLLLAGPPWTDPTEGRAAVLRHTRWAALKAIRTRHRRAARELGAAAADSPADWARSEARALCEQIVEQLRPSYRVAIQYRYVEGCSNAEAAQRLNISVNAFEVRLHRALRAARRAARNVDIVPGLVSAGVGVVHKLRRVLRITVRQLTPVARTAVLGAGACAVVVHVGPLLAGSHIQPEPAAWRVSMTTVVTPAPSGSTDTSLIDEAHVVDATVAKMQDGAIGVVALGEGRLCQCWELFQSADGGASWRAVPAGVHVGPGARINVPLNDPTDTRLFVSDGYGRILVSQGFGQGFLPLVGSAPPLTTVRPVTCAVRARPIRCGGQLVESLPSDSVDAGGRLLPLLPGRSLYLRPFGGVLCSADAGGHWQVRCPLAGTRDGS